MWEDGYTPSLKEEIEVVDIFKNRKILEKGTISLSDRKKVASILGKNIEEIEER